MFVDKLFVTVYVYIVLQCFYIQCIMVYCLPIGTHASILYRQSCNREPMILHYLPTRLYKHHMIMRDTRIVVVIVTEDIRIVCYKHTCTFVCIVSVKHLLANSFPMQNKAENITFCSHVQFLYLKEKYFCFGIIIILF